VTRDQKQNRHAKGLPAVQASEVQVGFNVFLAKLERATVRLPGLGKAVDEEDDDDPLFGRFGTAIGDTSEELDKLGYDEDVAGAVIDRAICLKHTLEKLKIDEPTDLMFEVAATLPLGYGAHAFGSAEFLKGLKKLGAPT